MSCRLSVPLWTMQRECSCTRRHGPTRVRARQVLTTSTMQTQARLPVQPTTLTFTVTFTLTLTDTRHHLPHPALHGWNHDLFPWSTLHRNHGHPTTLHCTRCNARQQPLMVVLSPITVTLTVVVRTQTATRVLQRIPPSRHALGFEHSVKVMKGKSF